MVLYGCMDSATTDRVADVFISIEGILSNAPFSAEKYGYQ